MLNAYAATTLVHGRNEALKSLDDPDPYGHAVVTSFITGGEHIDFYANFCVPSEGGEKLGYHQYPLYSTNLLFSFECFSHGRRQFRNLHEDAQLESVALRDRLGVPTGESDARRWTVPSQDGEC